MAEAPAASRIPVQNVYYLLCYAWDRLEERDLVDVGAENCKTLQDLFARVLINGTRRLIKRGFHRAYLPHEEETESLRGRIAFTPSIRQMSWVSGRMVCEYTDLSYNTLPNRILKTTLRSLMFTEGLDKGLVDKIGNILRLLNEVKPVRLTSRLFRRIQYHQNMRFYRFLMNVCELVYESLLPNQQSGQNRFRDFLQDPNKMPLLFENFVRNFYRQQLPACHVGNHRFEWAGLEADSDVKALYPTLNTDVEIRHGKQQLIIDCKFYLNAFTEHRDVERFRTKHLYQLYAYLRNKSPGQPSTNTSGMLLYPETSRSFTYEMKLQGHPITIASVNLDEHWQNIARRLNALAPRFTA